MSGKTTNATLEHCFGNGNKIFSYAMSDETIALATRALEEAQGCLTVRPEIVVMGKKCRSPRNFGMFSASHPGTDELMVAGYRFSGQTAKSHAATGALGELLAEINAMFGTTSMNAMLVNDYPAGDWSSIGAHGDTEKDLVTDNYIGVVGINLYDQPMCGKPRKMVWRERATGAKFELLLKHGTIFQMVGPTFQKDMTHEIPKQKNSARRRSVTFRQHVVRVPKRPREEVEG